MDRICPYCPAALTGRRVQCGSVECKRQWNTDRCRAYQRAYAAEHGRSHTHRNDPLVMVRGNCTTCGKDLYQAFTDTPVCKECRTAKKPARPLRPIRTNVCIACMQPYVVGQGYFRGFATCSQPCHEEARRVLGRKKPDSGWQERRIECPMCGEEFSNPYTTVAQVCSKKCARRRHKRRRRTREAATYGEWRWSDFMRVARKFGYCCAYCGVKPERLDPDHVVPLSKGGPNIIGNLLPACARCNTDKRDLSLDDWDADRHRRGLPPVATSWAAEDRRYHHLTVLTTRAAVTAVRNTT
jgi:hypothetical protein